jgi:tRNA 2-selenouridine synthase
MSLLTPLNAIHDFDAWIDARTPTEFAYDHLPGAINLPVLSDSERHDVGLRYAQSPFLGRQRGAILIARNIAHHLEATLSIHPASWKPLVYCWRGGKRSGAFTHILRQIGWQAGQLQGGYKAFRRLVIDINNTLPTTIKWLVIGGATGCRKTAMLREIAKLGGQILDLEALAEHKGSVLGGFSSEGKQPSQPQFENRLAEALKSYDPSRVVFVEAESRRIGQCHLPTALILAIRNSPIIPIQAERSTRVQALLEDYADKAALPAWLIDRLHHLRQYHSATRLAQWHQLIETQQWAELVEALIVQHYDPAYEKSALKNYGQRQHPPCHLTHADDYPRLARFLWESFDNQGST